MTKQVDSNAYKNFVRSYKNPNSTMVLNNKLIDLEKQKVLI